MDTGAVYRDLVELPPEAQQQVAEFVAFLRQRQRIPLTRKRSTKSVALADEPFVGMWRDRADMADSSMWVREGRRREWGDTGG